MNWALSAGTRRCACNMRLTPVVGPRVRCSALISLGVVFSLLGCSSPEREWRRTTQTNSIEAYEAFLRDHPESPFASEARDRLEALVWEDARGKGTAEGYKDYLTKYPSGVQVRNANSNLAMVEDLLVDVVAHGSVLSASCGPAEAVVLDIKAPGGGMAVFTSRLIHAQRHTGEWVPLHRFVIVDQENASRQSIVPDAVMEYVVLRSCLENADSLKFEGVSLHLGGERGYWAFRADTTYSTRCVLYGSQFVRFGFDADVRFLDDAAVRDYCSVERRNQDFVFIYLDEGGTVRTVLLFPSNASSITTRQMSRLVAVRAFGHALSLTRQDH